MKTQSILALTLALFAFASADLAYANDCGDHSCLATHVARIFPTEAGGIAYRIEGSTAQLTCASTKANAYLTLEPSHAAFKETFSMILAAFLAGKPVNFRLRGVNDAGDCRIGYAYLDR